MEKFSQFRDRGRSSPRDERLLLIEPRLRDRALPTHSNGTGRLPVAFLHLPLHDPGALAFDRYFDLLPHSTVASHRGPGKEGCFMVDIGGSRHMVD